MFVQQELEVEELVLKICRKIKPNNSKAKMQHGGSQVPGLQITASISDFFTDLNRSGVVPTDSYRPIRV